MQRFPGASEPIEILWPPPEVTVWARVAEASRMRADARDLFGSFHTPTSEFARVNGVSRLLHSPSEVQHRMIHDCDDGVCERGLGAGSPVVVAQSLAATSIRIVDVEATAQISSSSSFASSPVNVPPGFDTIWSRYLRNRIPTCNRVDTPHQRFYNHEGHDETFCARLRAPLKQRATPSAPPPPFTPSPPPAPFPPQGARWWEKMKTSYDGSKTTANDPDGYYFISNGAMATDVDHYKREGDLNECVNKCKYEETGCYAVLYAFFKNQDSGDACYDYHACYYYSCGSLGNECSMNNRNPPDAMDGDIHIGGGLIKCTATIDRHGQYVANVAIADKTPPAPGSPPALPPSPPPEPAFSTGVGARYNLVIYDDALLNYTRDWEYEFLQRTRLPGHQDVWGWTAVYNISNPWLRELTDDTTGDARYRLLGDPTTLFTYTYLEKSEGGEFLDPFPTSYLGQNFDCDTYRGDPVKYNASACLWRCRDDPECEVYYVAFNYETRWTSTRDGVLKLMCYRFALTAYGRSLGRDSVVLMSDSINKVLTTIRDPVTGAGRTTTSNRTFASAYCTRVGVAAHLTPVWQDGAVTPPSPPAVPPPPPSSPPSPPSLPSSPPPPPQTDFQSALIGRTDSNRGGRGTTSSARTCAKGSVVVDMRMWAESSSTAMKTIMFRCTDGTWIWAGDAGVNDDMQDAGYGTGEANRGCIQTDALNGVVSNRQASSVDLWASNIDGEHQSFGAGQFSTVAYTCFSDSELEGRIDAGNIYGTIACDHDGTTLVGFGDTFFNDDGHLVGFYYICRSVLPTASSRPPRRRRGILSSADDDGRDVFEYGLGVGSAPRFEAVSRLRDRFESETEGRWLEKSGGSFYTNYDYESERRDIAMSDVEAMEICERVACVYYQRGKISLLGNADTDHRFSARFWLSMRLFQNASTLEATPDIYVGRPLTRFLPPDTDHGQDKDRVSLLANETHRRLYRTDFVFSLAADSTLSDEAYRPVGAQTRTASSAPEWDGGFLDGSAFWQFHSFSWVFPVKHRYWPRETNHTTIDRYERRRDTRFFYESSRAAFASSLSRRPDTLNTAPTDLLLGDEAYARRWARHALSIAVGQLNEDDRARLQVALDAFGEWLCDDAYICRFSGGAASSAGARIAGPHLVFPLRRAVGGAVADAEVAWPEATALAKRVCRAINTRTLSTVRDGIDPPLPETVVQCDAGDCVSDLKLLPAVWMLCKGVTVSTLIRGDDDDDDDDDFEDSTTTGSRVTELALGFALDAAWHRPASAGTPTRTVTAATVDRERISGGELTRATCDEWSGLRYDREWSSSASTSAIGSCATVVTLSEVRTPAVVDTDIAASSSSTESSDDEGARVYPATDHAWDRGAVNLCATLPWRVSRAFYAHDGGVMNLESENAANPESPVRDRKTLRAVSLRERDAPVGGTCLTLLAPPNPRTFASDHGFLWGPSVSVISSDVADDHAETGGDNDVTSTRLSLVKNSSTKADAFVLRPGSDPFGADASIGTYDGMIDAPWIGSERSGTSDARVLWPLVHSLPSLFFPENYTRSNGDRVMLARGFRPYATTLSPSSSSTENSSGGYRSFCKREILPVIVYEMYDVDDAEGTGYAGGTDVHFTTLLTVLGVGRTVVGAYGASNVTRWQDTWFRTFDYRATGEGASPFAESGNRGDLARQMWRTTAPYVYRYHATRRSALDAPPTPSPSLSSSSSSSPLFRFRQKFDQLSSAPGSKALWRGRLFTGNGVGFAQMLDRSPEDVEQDLCQSFNLRFGEERERALQRSTFNWEVYYRFTCWDPRTACETPSAIEDAPIYGPYRNAFFENQILRDGTRALNNFRVTGDHAHAVFVMPPIGAAERKAFVVVDEDNDAGCICKADTGQQTPHTHISTDLPVCGTELSNAADDDGDDSDTGPRDTPHQLSSLYGRCAIPEGVDTDDDSDESDSDARIRRGRDCAQYAEPDLYDGRRLCRYEPHFNWQVDCLPSFGVCAHHGGEGASTCEKALGRRDMCAYDATTGDCHQRYVACGAMRYEPAVGECRGDVATCASIDDSRLCRASSAGCAWHATATGGGGCFAQRDAASDCQLRVGDPDRRCEPTVHARRVLETVFAPSPYYTSNAGDDERRRRRRLLTPTTSGRFYDSPRSLSCGGRVTPDERFEVSVLFVACENDGANSDRHLQHPVLVIDGVARQTLVLDMSTEYIAHVDASTAPDSRHSTDATTRGYSLIFGRRDWHSATATDRIAVLDPSGVYFPRFLRADGDDAGAGGATDFAIDAAGFYQSARDDDITEPRPRRAAVQVLSAPIARGCAGARSRSCCHSIVAAAFGADSVERVRGSGRCLLPADEGDRWIALEEEHAEERIVVAGDRAGCEIYNHDPHTLFACSPHCDNATSRLYDPVACLSGALRANDRAAVCGSDAYRFVESELCERVVYAIGARVPMHLTYYEGGRSGMGGALELYADRSTRERASLGDGGDDDDDDDVRRGGMASHALFRPVPKDREANIEIPQKTKDAKPTPEMVVTLWSRFWKLSWSAVPEYESAVYIRIKEDVANVVRELADDYYPGVAEFLFHSVRYTAEMSRSTISGLSKVLYTYSQRERLDPNRLWNDYLEPVFDEHSAVVASAFDWLHYFMSIDAANDQRSARAVCLASNMPNHILRGSLKIAELVSTAASYPGVIGNTSVACDATRSDCKSSDEFVEAFADMNLNPVCAMTTLLSSASVEDLGGSAEFAKAGTVNQRIASSFVYKKTGLRYTGASIVPTNTLRKLRAYAQYGTEITVEMMNCALSEKGRDCHALADDLVYPTALINLYITLSWETQVHLANMATSFTSYLWSYLYVAAEYDPSLYTPLSNWPRPGSFEATLPASPCVGLAHASCVGQGMGRTTDPGANNYLRYDDAGRIVVVHACERELCHCAWLIDQSDFDTYRGGFAGRLYQRSRVTGVTKNSTWQQALTTGFDGFAANTLKYYMTSKSGIAITTRGYDDGEVLGFSPGLTTDAKFPYWLYANGRCVSACELLEKKSCSRNIATVTPEAVAGSPPPFLRVGCVHSSRYGCSGDVQNIQPYPLEAATSTLIVSFMSFNQYAVIATNQTIAFFYHRFITLATSRDLSEDDAGSEIVRDLMEFKDYYYIPQLFDLSISLLWLRDMCVAVLEWVRAIILVTVPGGSSIFFDFQRDTMEMVGTLEAFAELAGSELLGIFEDGVRFCFLFLKSAVDTISGDTADLEDDWKKTGEALFDIIKDFGGALMQLIYRCFEESPFGKLIMSLINDLCVGYESLTDVSYELQKIFVCDVLKGRIGYPDGVHTDSKRTCFGALGCIKLPVNIVLSWKTWEFGKLFGLNDGDFELLHCDCPKPEEMTRIDEDPFDPRYASSKYDGCLRKKKCEIPRGIPSQPFRPFEASQCRARGEVGIESIYQTAELPGSDIDWDRHCAVCWATSERQCLETRTGGPGTNGVRAGVWSTYSRSHFTENDDAMSVCALFEDAASCEAHTFGDYRVPLCVWDADFYANRDRSDDTEGDTAGGSPGVCLGRRTVKMNISDSRASARCAAAVCFAEPPAFANAPDGEPQAISVCLARSRVSGPALCRDRCAASVMNAENLLYHHAPVDLRASKNLDLEEAVRSSVDIPLTEFCTCDIGLRWIVEEAIAHGEGPASLDVVVDTERGTAHRRIGTDHHHPPYHHHHHHARTPLEEGESTIGDDPFFVEETPPAENCAMHDECYAPSAVCENSLASLTLSPLPAVLCAACSKLDAFSVAAPRRYCDPIDGRCRCGTIVEEPRVERPDGDDADERGTDDRAWNLTAFALTRAQAWPGDTLCDRMMRRLGPRIRAANDDSMKVMDALTAGEYVQARDCIDRRAWAMRVGLALDLPTFPVDVAYNWRRPFGMAIDLARGLYIILSMNHTDRATAPRRIVEALGDAGVDPEFVGAVYDRLIDPMYRTLTRDIVDLEGLATRAYNVTARSAPRVAEAARKVGTRFREDTPRWTAYLGNAPAVLGEAKRIVVQLRRAYSDRAAADPAKKALFESQIDAFRRRHYHAWSADAKAEAASADMDGAGERRRRRRGLLSSLSTDVRIPDFFDPTDVRPNSRSESCAVYAEVNRGVGMFTNFLADFSQFRSASTLRSSAYTDSRNHTFQHTICGILRAFHLYDHERTVLDEHGMITACRVITESENEHARSPWTLAREEREKLWPLDWNTGLSGILRREARRDGEHDITRTPDSLRHRLGQCGKRSSATELVLCAYQGVSGLDFDRDIADILVDDVWRQRAAVNGTLREPMRSIGGVDIYDSAYVGVAYDRDVGRLNSETLSRGNVHFYMREMRALIATNFYDDRDIQWREWYDRWNNDDHSKKLSHVPLRDVNGRVRVPAFSFYPYWIDEPAAEWWSTDLGSRGGRVPPHLFMGVCQFRNATTETVRTNIARWCDENNKEIRDKSFGVAQTRRWRHRGYAADGDRFGWYKLPFRGAERDASEKRARMNLLEPDLDYPSALHRLVYDPTKTRTVANFLEAEDERNRSAITRLDIYWEDFYDNATVRLSAYDCICADLKSNPDDCRRDRECIAPNPDFFRDRGYLEAPNFVYDNGGWWDCRVHASPAARSPPCVPIPASLLDTVAETRAGNGGSVTFTSLASKSDDAAHGRSCNELGLRNCSRRNTEWPFVSAAMFYTVALVVAVAVARRAMPGFAPWWMYSIAFPLAGHLALQRSYEWQLDCYPGLPTCLADDIADGFARFLFPEHIEWPASWARRNSVNGRLYDNVDCSASPYGFVDGYRNLFYLMERHAGSTMRNIRKDRRSVWFVDTASAYTNYYEAFDELRNVDGRTTREEIVQVFDSCHSRTFLNYIPAIVFTAAIAAAALWLSTIGMAFAILAVSVISSIRDYLLYAVTLVKMRLFVLSHLQNLKRNC
ncbi:hypothetical protein CYMTET_46606 [Cymbomonas tetramitiformis]|uniref:Uncharacterized protein n=1 Tax=Cymbomonas tetramitiformis TaxID=36881 RepID=A0AAE0EWX3_9CHLO|nr:hypothetical protein CYMTET_46606 [Cymbomonas tetramitiformis]